MLNRLAAWIRRRPDGALLMALFALVLLLVAVLYMGVFA